MSPMRSWPKSAWVLVGTAPAPAGGGGRAEGLYFFATSGQACASTEGKACSGGISFTTS
jgi:hypothetical protein